MSRKLASASWSLLALASIPGAAQGHHVIFNTKGGDPLFLFRPNTYRGTCMSIEHSICALQGSRGILE